MTTKVLQTVQTVAAPLDEVFDFFSKPENLAALTPADMRFEILTPSPVPMHAGALIDYRIRVGLLPMRWRTLITAYEPPHRFVDEQLSGPYDLWHHEHRFRAVDDGTEIEDVVHYRLPLGPLGDLAHRLGVRTRLEGIFSYRRSAVAQRFGGTS